MKTIHKSKYRRILDLFESKGEATNQELSRICLRYGARIKELRDDGHIIVISKMTDTLFRYVYMGQKDEDDRTSILSVD